MKKKIQFKKMPARVTIVSSLVMIVFIIFMFQLISAQIVHGEEYAAALKRLDKYKVDLQASRGEIFDRNGSPLVTNRSGYSLVFDRAYFPGESLMGQPIRNEIILSLINLLEGADEKWIDTLPLYYNEEGEIDFIKKREGDISYLKSSEGLNPYATARNCFDSLVERFRLTEYREEDALKIASVCYAMKRDGFSISSPYTFAADISIETAARVKENSDFYTGVDVAVMTYREYVEGALAVHLLGNVGAISAEEYAEKKEEYEAAIADPEISEEEKAFLRANQYKLNDTIGKLGVERAMERYLRGTLGTKQVNVDASGKASSEYTVAPKTGDTVILTIDKDLQRVTQKALEKRIRELTVGAGLEAAGACVVLNINTGEVLASASYPAFNLETFAEDYPSLAKNKASPLWNRAFQSTYAPGSTMKPVVSVAALETETIERYTPFLCESVFNYRGSEFRCLASHGYLDVAEALNKSCNIFFYKTADILGISRMNDYSLLFGLGIKTGVDLPESGGVLASVAYSESVGRDWNPGDTLQAAIGQSDNLFTPLQLANYCATIANGGTRYVPYVIKSVKSFDYSETLIDNKPRVAVNTGVSQSSLDIVRQGMKRLVDVGTCREAFKDTPVSVAAKTGTSQTEKYVEGIGKVRGNNGFLISFAPYENSEIAVAVVIENINSGTKTAEVAADIYKYYFTRTIDIPKAEIENALLN